MQIVFINPLARQDQREVNIVAFRSAKVVCAANPPLGVNERNAAFDATTLTWDSKASRYVRGANGDTGDSRVLTFGFRRECVC